MKKIFLLALCLSFINVAISGACIGTVKISATPTSVNLGSVKLGATSAPQVVTLKNTGTCDLSISLVSITGTDSAEFGQTNSCGTIAPGGSCPVNVTFTPALPYAKKTALLTIASSDPKKPLLNVKLSGKVPPPKISATPGSLNFGKLPAGTVSSAKSVTIENNGLSDLMISSIDIAGTDPGDFSDPSICGMIKNGESCTIGITFAPLVPKVTRSATLDISSNDPKKPVLKVKLSGSLRGDNTISLPQTGQTTCYNASGNTIPCTGTGQDGALQEGVAWPIPRFTNNNDQTITDELTGLMWTQDANAPSAACTPGVTKKTWQEALDYAACLNTHNYLSHNDWRLPNIMELRSLANYGESDVATWLNDQGFSNVQGNNYYWSSTTSAWSSPNALIFNMYRGQLNYVDKTVDLYYVWPVRTAYPKSDNLPKTGQTFCYDAAGTVIACAGTGQDGALREGITWPHPRFKDNGDQTITDKLTGLIWAKDGGGPGPAACNQAEISTWQEALDYVACLNTNNYLGHNDWRLPNVNELYSLVNYGQSDPATWLNTQGFRYASDNYYWSSTTDVVTGYTNYALSVYRGWGTVYSVSKTTTVSVWPVRAGQ